MMVADYCPGDIPNILLAFHSHTGCSRKGSDQNTTLKIVTAWHRFIYTKYLTHKKIKTL